jgi:DNA-binding CsgD family transcriptional regulator
MDPFGALVGRNAELSLLDDLVTCVLAGRGGVAWVEGESGIGKTVLVSAVVEHAAKAGCLAIVGRADESARAFPLSLMADCLHGLTVGGEPAGRGVAGTAGSMLSSRVELFDVEAADPVWAAGERLLALVDRLCADHAVVLVAEDLQWADKWSLGLWARLAQSVDQIPLLLVGTCRPGDHRLARLRMAVQGQGSWTIDVPPLSDGDVAGLAAALAGGAVGAALGAVLARAGGNPLYVRELVDGLMREGLVRVESGVAELVGEAASLGGVLPGSLVESIGRRLRFLSPATYRALHSAALLSAEFGAGEWATVTAHSAGELSEIVDEAVTAGVLVSGRRGLMFRHELIRQVLVERTPATVRVELHRDMARLLAVAGRDIDLVAAHLMAVPGLDEWAFGWLAHQPEAVMLSAPEVSADLLDRAVGLLDRGDPLWEVLAARLARVAFWLGQDEAAGEMAESVVARTTDGELAGRMRVQSIRAAGRMGRFEVAVAGGEAAEADPRLPARWRARARAWSAHALLNVGRPAQAQARALDALDEAQRCGDGLASAYARFVLYKAGGARQGSRLVEALADLDDDADSQDLRFVLLNLLLILGIEQGQWGETETAMAAALVAADRVGPIRTTHVSSIVIWLHYLRGDWDEALRQLAALPTQYVDMRAYCRAAAAMIGVRRDDSRLVSEQMRLANVHEDNISTADPYTKKNWAPVLARKAEAAADLHRALACHKMLIDLPAKLFEGVLDEVPDLVRVALEVGDSATAGAAVEACRKAAEATGKRLDALAARLCQAQLANDAEELLAVAEDLQTYGSPPLRACGLEEAACRLARDGAHQAARTALNQAVDVYADLGATCDIRRAHTRLRALGVRRGSRSPRRRVTHGWESLTPTQQRVAELVAKGLSNPDIAAQLFVSRNTVQSHMSSILSKLGMRSRIELILYQADHNPTSNEGP